MSLKTNPFFEQVKKRQAYPGRRGTRRANEEGLGTSERTGGPGGSGVRVFLGRCLLTKKYFCAVYDYAGKADLSKGYCNRASFRDN